MAKKQKRSQQSFNLERGNQPTAVPSPSTRTINKVAFYFGDTHKKYSIDSTKDKTQKARLADVIHLCSQLTREELQQRDRHSNGAPEKIPVTSLTITSLPRIITPDVQNVYSMRFTNNHRLIGIFRENLFVVLFVDYKLKLYNHGS